MIFLDDDFSKPASGSIDISSGDHTSNKSKENYKFKFGRPKSKSDKVSRKKLKMILSDYEKNNSESVDTDNFSDVPSSFEQSLICASSSDSNNMTARQVCLYLYNTFTYLLHLSIFIYIYFFKLYTQIKVSSQGCSRVFIIKGILNNS